MTSAQALSQQLLLFDLTGRERMSLADRRARVVTAPFGLDFKALGFDPDRVPISILVGTWWPLAANREATIKPSRFSRRQPQAKAWGSPTISEFAKWRLRQGAKEGAILGAMGLFLLVLTGPQIAQTGFVGEWWWAAGILGFCVLMIGFGAIRLWQARHELGRELRTRVNGRGGGILKRNG